MRNGVHPATCCISGEYPTGLAGRRCVYSHPRFLRQIIHLDLVGELRMHNGKNITHCCTEENERRVSRGGCRGRAERSMGVTRLPALLAERSLGSGRRRLADRDTSDCSSGSWQVVAIPSNPRSARWVSPACDRTSQPFDQRRFLPYQAAGAGQPLEVLPLGPSRRDGLAGWPWLIRRGRRG